MAFLKGQSWLVLKSWYTSVGPEQGFQRCFAGELNQSLVSSVAQANHRINIYYASIDKVLSELELRFSGNDQETLCALGNTCHSETPDKESLSSPALLNFFKIDGEILEAKQKMLMSFRCVHGLGHLTVPEMLETVHENDLFDMSAVFSNAVHILGVIPATLCSAERSFSALRRLKTYLRSTTHTQSVHMAQSVSNIALINIDRAYVNSVVNKDMDRIID